MLTVIGLASATAFVPASVIRLALGLRVERASQARVVATGLDNPRHLAFQGGSLYVAEAAAGPRPVTQAPRAARTERPARS